MLCRIRISASWSSCSSDAMSTRIEWTLLRRETDQNALGFRRDPLPFGLLVNARFPNCASRLSPSKPLGLPQQAPPRKRASNRASIPLAVPAQRGRNRRPFPLAQRRWCGLENLPRSLLPKRLPDRSRRSHIGEGSVWHAVYQVSID